VERWSDHDRQGIEIVQTVDGDAEVLYGWYDDEAAELADVCGGRDADVLAYWRSLGSPTA
jgi:hypothetical protein